MTSNRKQSAREKALEKCGYKCVICGWDEKKLNGEPLVIGCHIYDFSKAPEFDNFDNIIALCPNHHVQFDNFLFYIDTKDRTVVHSDPNNKYNGVKLEIEYVNKRCLAYRQGNVTKYWKKKRIRDE